MTEDVRDAAREEVPSLARRVRNASIPALVFGLALMIAGGIVWYQNADAGAADKGREVFVRLAWLGLSIGLAAFICRMLAGARSARLGLLRPEPGDVGAIGWFLTHFIWGVMNSRPLPEDAPLGSKLMTWLISGLLDSPLYVVFVFALLATAVFAVADLSIRRLISGRTEPA